MSYCLDYLDEKSQADLNSHICTSHRLTRELSYQIYEDATILPERNVSGKVLGGVVDSSLNYIEQSAFHEGYGGVQLC